MLLACYEMKRKIRDLVEMILFIPASCSSVLIHSIFQLLEWIANYYSLSPAGNFSIPRTGDFPIIPAWNGNNYPLAPFPAWKGG